MLKTYQFKTNCKGDSHSSKTTNIILPGLMIKQTFMNVLTSASEMVFKYIELQMLCWLKQQYSSHPSWIAYYISLWKVRITFYRSIMTERLMVLGIYATCTPLVAALVNTSIFHFLCDRIKRYLHTQCKSRKASWVRAGSSMQWHLVGLFLGQRNVIRCDWKLSIY